MLPIISWAGGGVRWQRWQQIDNEDNNEVDKDDADNDDNDYKEEIMPTLNDTDNVILWHNIWICALGSQAMLMTKIW